MEDERMPDVVDFYMLQRRDNSDGYKLKQGPRDMSRLEGQVCSSVYEWWCNASETNEG